MSWLFAQAGQVQRALTAKVMLSSRLLWNHHPPMSSLHRSVHHDSPCTNVCVCIGDKLRHPADQHSRTLPAAKTPDNQFSRSAE
jgi:hypothetical protein